MTGGGGSVFAPAVATDANGYADELWTLGPRLGPQTVAARSVSDQGTAETYGTFTANATPPLVLVTGTNSTGIILMYANGTNVKQVLTTGSQDYSPFLSPNHAEIVFYSKRVADSISVFLMKADGSNPHKIGPAMYYTSGPPQWSPAGNLITFAGQPTNAPDVDPGYPQTYCCSPGIITIDTLGNPYSLQYFLEDEAGPATFTANGLGTLFFCDDACFGASGLFLEPGDGQILGCWSACLGGQVRSAWDLGAVGAAPDGVHIAFVGEPEGSGQQSYLYTMNIDGTGITPLTSALGLGQQVTYSPDGQIIAIDHGFVNADGTNYQTVQGCPCAFAPNPVTTTGALAKVFRVRRNKQWFPLE